MPKVSVIIPTFNRANYICQAIDSVLAQTYQDFEIIIIDDGSADNTKKVLSKYESTIKYYYQGNKGVSVARNRGIQEARGEWIAFLDSDDIWLPEKLHWQHEILEMHPSINFIFTDLEQFNESGVVRTSMMRSQSQQPKGSFKRKILDEEFNNGGILIGNLYEEMLLLGNIPSTPTVIVKKICLEEVGFFSEDLSIAEDSELWLRISSKYSMLYFNKITVRARVSDEGLSGTLDRRSYRYREWDGHMLEIHLKGCLKSQKSLIKKRIAQSYRIVAWGYFDNNKLKEAQRLFLRSLNYNIFQIKVYLYLAVLLLPGKIINIIKRIKRQHAES